MRSARISLKSSGNGTATVSRRSRMETFRLDVGFISPMFSPCAGHGRASRSSDGFKRAGHGSAWNARGDANRGVREDRTSRTLHRQREVELRQAAPAREGPALGDRPDRTLRSNSPIQQLLLSRPGITAQTGRKVMRHYPPVARSASIGASPCVPPPTLVGRSERSRKTGRFVRVMVLAVDRDEDRRRPRRQSGPS
jgi:hypothetical protein